MQQLRSPFSLMTAVLLLTLSTAQCQSKWPSPVVEITRNDTVGHDFVRQSRNVIERPEALAPFYAKLLKQRTEGGQKINIVHIGDSHILGNFLTKEVRQRMQEAFGNAGRGLIFPYKLIRSNGPQDYLVSTATRWNGANCVRDLDEETDYGISGFSAVSEHPNGSITFRLRDTTSETSSKFTKVTVFVRNDAKSPKIELIDEVSRQKATLIMEDEYAQSWYFDRPVGECTIQAKGQKGKSKLWLDGISIDNERSGVIYHSIGVNGAKFSDFARSKYFARQLREVTPDLVILSFGTNEAQATHHPGQLTRQMDELVQQILAQWPHASILLTTPADSYLKGKGPNPYLPEVAETIRQYAEKKQFALWDLLSATGGPNSAEEWKSRGLMSADSVHYSKTGYAVQGKLLYQSLIKGYNEIAAKQGAAVTGEGK